MDDLDALRASFLRSLGEPLGPEDGDAAFDRHILLAVRIHRAAGLDKRDDEGEGASWTRYIVEHFPSPRNSSTDADFLWREWRTRLLKAASPRAITHGKPHAHWYPLPEGGVCIDLESMWNDLSYSVDHFIAALKTDSRRREIVLKRFHEREWTMREFPLVPSERLFPSETLYPGALAVSANTGPDLYENRAQRRRKKRRR